MLSIGIFVLYRGGLMLLIRQILLSLSEVKTILCILLTLG
jgi:hypothetical protein